MCGFSLPVSAQLLPFGTSECVVLYNDPRYQRVILILFLVNVSVLLFIGIYDVCSFCFCNVFLDCIVLELTPGRVHASGLLWNKLFCEDSSPMFLAEPYRSR